jgi:glycosyltransferase involved in cell wall biosynthesis
MFSVIVATYNREKTLLKSLESILKQTYTDVEVLVVDDGSTDGTEKLMKIIKDSRVRYIKLPINSGASVARNRGIQEATGDYILVWDSDDGLYPHALEKVHTLFEQHPEMVVVSAATRVLVNGIEKMYPHFPEGEVTLADVLCKKLPSNEKVRVARTGVMKQVSYKSRNIDFLVNVELIEKGRWYHTDEVLGDVHNNTKEGSLTASRKKKNVQYSIERAPHLVSFLERHGVYLKKINPARYADYCYGAAIGSLLGRNIPDARYLALEAVCNHTTKVVYWVMLICAYIPGSSRLLKIFY